jgi:hypothetical protein
MTEAVQPVGTASVPARLVRADGTTVITASSGAALISAAPDNDPPVIVAENVYVDSVPTGTAYPPIERQLKYHAGQKIKTSEWNSNFAAAVISTVSPATGPHAGGTPVTITGSNFSPDTTVAFGAVAATSVVVLSPTQITCDAPAQSGAGAVAVAVTTDAGTQSSAGAFTYT